MPHKQHSIGRIDGTTAPTGHLAATLPGARQQGGDQSIP
jgi:hypothetical protein